MAISKIRPRHASEGRSIAAVLKDRIDYDKNPDKTKGGLLVSSYQCSADTAWQEFALSKQIYEAETGRKRDPEKDVISYLIIQSFKPGEITPEDANKLGYQLALEFTGGQHQFLVATHVDKRHMGDSKSPMYFIAVACAANIGLDYLFMGPLHMGSAGAALGTTLSQAISVITSLAVIFRRKSGISVTKNDFRPQHTVMGKILKIGFPIALQDGLIQISFIVITIIANRRGLNDAAAVGIVEKVMSFLFLIPSSMLSTVSALGAQNIGAGKAERAKLTLRYAALIAVCFGTVIAITIQFIAEPVVALFTNAATQDGAETVRLGGQYLRGYVWDCIFAGIHFSFSGYFCACGKSIISFIHNIIAILLVRIPGVYLTSLLFPTTLFPMGLATAAGSLLSVMICAAAFIIYSKVSVH